MVYLPLVGVAILVALALGGRLGALAAIRLRAAWLFYVAIGLQLVAFPPAFMPFETGGVASRALWLASYACLLVAAGLNLRLRGVGLVLGGMVANLAAVLANGGVMPALPEAARAAGMVEEAKYNSVASSDPKLGWLVDRWAAPDWVPLANVFSVGDVVLGLGAFVLVLSAMDVRLSSRVRPRPAHG